MAVLAAGTDRQCHTYVESASFRSAHTANIPSVLPSSPLDSSVPLFAVVAQQLEISPVLKRSCSISCQQEEYRHTDVWYEVDGQQNDELRDLAEGEGRVDGGACGLAKSADGIVQGIFGEGSVLADKVFVAFEDQDSIEDVDLSFILC
jgi:hypothetical protein